MKLSTLIAAIAACLTTACAAAPANTGAETIAYVNGRWWDGEGFQTGERYVRDGLFVIRPRGGAASTIDLRGRYVIPAMAEAHHHRICDESVERFIRAGITYVGVMNARASSHHCQTQTYGPAGVDIVNAQAGFTEEGAHPSQIGAYFLAPEAIDGEWVHYVHAPSDLDRVWPRLEMNPPDLVKVFLSYSEDYEHLRTDASIPPWYRGLNPELVPEIVRRAHVSGLRVAAHVMSAHDFDVAVNAGVDIIAHMPGFAPGPAFTPDLDNPWLAHTLEEPQRYIVGERSAQRAAQLGVVVMTTLSGVEELPVDLPTALEGLVRFQQQIAALNINALRRAGVVLLIGSDRYDFTSIDEADYLVRQRQFTPKQALRSLTYDTPRTLFPGRAIGILQIGHEASFVVLRGNPLEDFNALRDPVAVYKCGAQLNSASETSP